MRTCLIIGAGVAGLVAARRVQESGWRALVIDKGRHPGGRLATRSVGGLACDHGAQFLSVRDPRFATLVEGWERAGQVRRWCDGFPVLTAGGVVAADGHPRWCAPGGFRTLGANLAEGLEVRSFTTVTHLDPAPEGGWIVALVPGDTVRGASTGPEEQVNAEAIICTLPGPQAAALLMASGLPVPEALTRIAYQPCHALLMAWPHAMEAILPAPGGVRIEDPSLPLGWMASQRAKGVTTTGEVLVVHATGGWSAKAEAVDPALLLPPLRDAARAALTRLGVRWPALPEVEVLHRWKYSLPIRTETEEFLRLPAPSPFLLAGDGFGDRPRIEGAALSGLAAAEALAT